MTVTLDSPAGVVGVGALMLVVGVAMMVEAPVGVALTVGMAPVAVALTVGMAPVAEVVGTMTVVPAAPTGATN